jgi:hypothetical protein
MTISSYNEDPSVDDTELEKTIASGFELGADDRQILSNDRVKILEETLRA